MIAHEEMWAGVKVMLVRGSTTHVRRADKERPDEAARIIGIVDPFFSNGKGSYNDNQVDAGERFYVYLKPGSINSLRHEWTHPMLGEAPKMAVVTHDETMIAEAVYQQLVNGPHKQLLQDFANEIDVDLDELLQGAADYVAYGDYMSDGGKFEGTSVPPGFWEAYQAVTGKTVPTDKQDSFFSCSC